MKLTSATKKINAIETKLKILNINKLENVKLL